MEHGSGSDGENGDVLAGFDLGEDLVEGEFGEGVAAGADEDDVLAAFDSADAVYGLVEGVEEIGLGEAGDHEGLEGLSDEFLVIGEVGEDVGVHVIGDDGDVVVLTEGAEEVVGGVPHVVDEVVAVGGELKQHDGGDGSLGDADAGDGLGNTVLEDEEVVGFEAGDELVGLVEDDVGVDVDHGNVDAEGVSVAVGILDFGLGWGCWSRWDVFCVLLFLEDDGAVIGRGALVVGGRLSGGFLLLRGWRGVLSPGCGRREQQEDRGCEEDKGRRAGMSTHRLKLYSDSWTGLKGQGEN